MAKTGPNVFDQLGIDIKGKSPGEVLRELRDSHPELLLLNQGWSDAYLTQSVAEMMRDAAKDQPRPYKGTNQKPPSYFSTSTKQRESYDLAMKARQKAIQSNQPRPLPVEAHKNPAKYFGIYQPSESYYDGPMDLVRIPNRFELSEGPHETKSERPHETKIDNKKLANVYSQIQDQRRAIFGLPSEALQNADQPNQSIQLPREASENPLVYVTEALKSNSDTIDAKLLKKAIASLDSKKALTEAGDLLGATPKEIIKELQVELSKRGLYNYNIDGIVGHRTKKAMLNLLSSSEYPGSNLDKPQRKRKTPNEHVLELQSKLIDLGLYSGKPTGVMDTGTRHGIMALQELLANNNLYDGKIDGIYGKKTIDGLRTLEGLRYDLAAQGAAEEDPIFSYFNPYQETPNVTDYSDFRM